MRHHLFCSQFQRSKLPTKGEKTNLQSDCTTMVARKTRKTNGAKPSASALSITNVYIVIWCLFLLQPVAEWLLFGQGTGFLDVRPLVAADWQWLLPAVVATLVATLSNYAVRLPLAVLGHAVDLGIRVSRMPDVWDHEYWGWLMNVAFVACYLPRLTVSRRDAFPGAALQKAEATFSRLVRLQLGLLYAAATFWKLNPSFLDPTYSCGTVLMTEVLGTYTWGSLPESLVQFVIAVAPSMTLAIEGGIALGMTCVGLMGRNTPGRRMVRDATLGLGLVFHMVICMMPVNAAGGFSLDCMTRFVLFFETDDLERAQQWVTRAKHSLWLGAAAVVPTVLIQWRQAATGAPMDVGFCLAGLLLVFYVLVMVGSARGAGSATPVVSTPVRQGWTGWVRTTLVLALTAMYGVGGPILGLMQMGAPTMYANLLNYHGGNHYLVPTAILGDDILYGGGFVQVVASTSTSVNLRLGYIASADAFPARILDLLEPHVRQSMPDMPVQFFPFCLSNPHSRERLMDVYRASNPPGSSSFVPFVIPISLFRTALREANEAQETYEIMLADSLEANPSVRIKLDSSGDCHTMTDGMLYGATYGSCTDHSLATLVLQAEKDMPGHGSLWKPLVDKLLIPYPQLVGMSKEVCTV
jgi:hypothetical protein